MNKITASWLDRTEAGQYLMSGDYSISSAELGRIWEMKSDCMRLKKPEPQSPGREKENESM